MGHKLTAFRGRFRLWHVDDVKTLVSHGSLPRPAQSPGDWRIV